MLNTTPHFTCKGMFWKQSRNSLLSYRKIYFILIIIQQNIVYKLFIYVVIYRSTVKLLKVYIFHANKV